MPGCGSEYEFEESNYGGSFHRQERKINIKDKFDLEKGVLVLSGEIDNSVASLLVYQLLYFKDTSPQKPITLYINSDGGSLTAGMAIYDTLCFIPNPVTTIAVEKVSGIAALILAAGRKGMRYICEETQVSFGQFYSTPYVQLASEVYSSVEKICEVIAKHTGRTKAEVKEMMIAETLFQPRDAVAFGIVDGETDF